MYVSEETHLYGNRNWRPCPLIFNLEQSPLSTCWDLGSWIGGCWSCLYIHANFIHIYSQRSLAVEGEERGLVAADQQTEGMRTIDSLIDQGVHDSRSNTLLQEKRQRGSVFHDFGDFHRLSILQSILVVLCFFRNHFALHTTNRWPSCEIKSCHDCIPFA